ncbi:hypothetical protein B0T10DRAFT_199973 [Thelonectria olida]|uniref:Azaphilone pigments biosynthesis cluster protein L N-terminal domain-containing protein n=1 Tax=Thelonectria olida TaxID=1576542 RepID=A0A9P8VW15_9HYPO|nr:hypothetical protein B0T10DRAFT_199973 [Thelonectria olida]
MEPFSIAASAIALTETATKLTSSLVSLVRAHLTAESRITALCSELTQLTGFLESVEKTLKGYRKYDFTLVDEQLWERSDAAMADCKTTLEELEILITKIQSHTQPRGFAWRTRAVVDLSLYGTEIASSRDKIHQSNWSLQTILHTMTISLQFRNMSWNTTAHDTVMAELRQLRTAIDETFHASSRPAGGFSNHQSDSGMARNMQRLAEAARHFYSSASSTASSTQSERSNVSINGEFPDSRRERVKDYVDQLQGTTQWSSSSPTPPLRNLAHHNQRRPLPTPDRMSLLDEDDVDAEFDRLFLNGLQELASASMKNQDYAKAIEYIKEALKRPNSCKEESNQLRIQLACCLLFQGAWEKAAPIITKLSDSDAEQDLVVCSLLHALALAYLLDYRFDDAMMACKKEIQGKRRLRNKNCDNWIEYSEALALYATIFHVQGDYIRAEVLRRQLPDNFTYVHPANEIQYLQSKSNLLEHVLADDLPHSHDIIELDAGPINVQNQTVSRAGTFATSNSLREKVMQYNRYEEDTMKEVTFVGSSMPPSPIDDVEASSPISPTRGSPLRRRLTRLLGSHSHRKSASPTSEKLQDDEADLGDTESVGLPSPGSSLRRRNATWFIKKSKTLLRKRNISLNPVKEIETCQKSDSGVEVCFPSLPERRRPPSVFSFDASEEEDITCPPLEHYGDSLDSLPLSCQSAIQRPGFSLYDPGYAGPNDDPRGQPLLAELREGDHMPDDGPSAGCETHKMPSPEMRSSTVADGVIATLLAASSSSTAPESMRSALLEAATILASVQTIHDVDTLRARRLDLEILLDRLRSMNNNLPLIEDFSRVIKDLEYRETAAFEGMEDSGYESLDDGSNSTRPAPARFPRLRRHNAVQNTSVLRRSFSWVAGSEDAYTAEANRHASLRPADDTWPCTNQVYIHTPERNGSSFSSSSHIHSIGNTETTNYEHTTSDLDSQLVDSGYSERERRVASHSRTQAGWDWHHDWVAV